MQPQNPEPEEEDDDLVVEFNLPTNMGICYVKGALTTGMQALVSSRMFLEQAGNETAVAYMKEAEQSLGVLIQLVVESESDVFMAMAQSRSGQAEGSEDSGEETTVPEFPGGFAKGTEGAGGPLTEGEY